MKRFAIALTLVLTATLPVSADNSIQNTLYAAEAGQEAPEGTFDRLLDRYRSQMVDMEYSSRRFSAYFSSLDHSIMQALNHTMQLADKVKGFGIGSPEGREAFYQLKQPLTHITMSIKNTPQLRHVVSMWDKSILTYQKLVNVFEGVDATPGQGVNPNHPGIRLLQQQAETLRQSVFAFEHQLKAGLPMVNQENQSLIAYMSQFSMLVDKLKTHSLSFITERQYMAETLRHATKVSRQINAIMLYNQNIPHLVLSWETIRSQANTMRQQYESLMNDMDNPGFPPAQ